MAIQQHKLRWSHSIEPWFLAYLLLGLTTGGLAMILIPVGMESFDSIGYIGLVTAVVGVGQLTAGAWGELADSYGLHRPLFVGGVDRRSCGAVSSVHIQCGMQIGMPSLSGRPTVT